MVLMGVDLELLDAHAARLTELDYQATSSCSNLTWAVGWLLLSETIPTSQPSRPRTCSIWLRKSVLHWLQTNFLKTEPENMHQGSGTTGL